MTQNNCHPDTSIDLDQVFQTLNHPARRYILITLEEQNQCDVDALATDQGDKGDLEQAPSLPDLHHNHLPRLNETEFVQWDRTAESVRRGPHFEDLRPLLKWIRNQDSPIS
jgi:hypothetical protein